MDILKIPVVFVFYLQLYVLLDKNQTEMAIVFQSHFTPYAQLVMKVMEMEIVCWLLQLLKIHSQFPIKLLKNLQ